MSSSCRRHAVSLSSSCRQHIVVVLPSYRRQPSAHCRRAVVSIVIWTRRDFSYPTRACLLNYANIYIYIFNIYIIYILHEYIHFFKQLVFYSPGLTVLILRIPRLAGPSSSIAGDRGRVSVGRTRTDFGSDWGWGTPKKRNFLKRDDDKTSGFWAVPRIFRQSHFNSVCLFFRKDWYRKTWFWPSDDEGDSCIFVLTSIHFHSHVGRVQSGAP